MASNWEMGKYLPEAVADYNYTLAIEPHEMLPETGEKKQVVHEYDDGSLGVVEISNTPRFDVVLKWDSLSETDAGTLLDLWHSSDKANGRKYTFYWQHPKETNIYVVRFMESLRIVHTAEGGDYVRVEQVTLRVEGVKAAVVNAAVSTSEAVGITESKTVTRT